LGPTIRLVQDDERSLAILGDCRCALPSGHRLLALELLAARDTHSTSG
jgi:hypothetical protein